MHPLDSTFRTFLLRLDPRLYAVLEKCAQDEEKIRRNNTHASSHGID